MEEGSNVNNVNIFEKVGVIFNPSISDAEKIAFRIKEEFLKNNINSTFVNSHKLVKDISFGVVIGGDGTMLSAARFYCNYDIPLMGVNLGRLGFLAQSDISEIEETVSRLLKNDFSIDERIMLSVDGTELNALNDIVIKGGQTLRTSRLYLYINDKPVCDYIADGLIISTPTGSTAYTLSAGGPIIQPSLDAFVIVPICPHSLSVRALVVPSYEKIQVKTCRSNPFLQITADGQKNIKMDADCDIIVTKYPKTTKLIHINKDNDDFYQILKKKIYWGVSPKRC